jgi:hypothetical protein
MFDNGTDKLVKNNKISSDEHNLPSLLFAAIYYD